MYIPLVAGAVLPGPATPSGAVPPAEGARRLEVVDQPAAPPDEVEDPPQPLDFRQNDTVPVTGAEPRRPEPTPGLPRPNGSPDASHPVLAPTALPGPPSPTVPPPSTTLAPTRPVPTPWVTPSTTPDPPTLEPTGGRPA